MKRSKFRVPDTFILLSSIIVLAAVLTWIIPASHYDTVEAHGKNVVVPESFRYVESTPQGFFAVLMAPLNGFADHDAAIIIAFILFIGGVFGVIQATGAIEAGLKRLAGMYDRSKIVRMFMIPIFMTLFSLGGAVFGMAEETLPFILIFVPLAWALGYDSITGVAIPLVGSGAGFAGAFINPFTLGVAQSIAELPPLSGFGYRLICWLVTTTVAIIFVMRYAAKVKADPESSPVYEEDKLSRHKPHFGMDTASDSTEFTLTHKAVLLSFAAGMVLLVYGVLEYGWYIAEIAGLFIAISIVTALVARMSGKQFTDAFINGSRDLVATALVVALARGILVIAQDGQIIHTVLHSLSGLIEGFHPIVSAQLMFLTQTAINFFVPSGSGQAALTMPIMAPLSDLVGVTRQTAVLAYQFGDGFSNLIIPTAGVLMGALTLAGIPWEKWARWILTLELLFLLVGFALLVPPFYFGWH